MYVGTAGGAIIIIILGALFLNYTNNNNTILSLWVKQKASSKEEQQQGEGPFLRKEGGVSNNNNNAVNSDEKKIFEQNKIYLCSTTFEKSTEFIKEYFIPVDCTQPVGIAIDHKDERKFEIYHAPTKSSYPAQIAFDSQGLV